MLKKTVTYTNFNDEVCTEDLYFNLTKAEIVELQWSKKEGLDVMLANMVKAKDTPELLSTLKTFVLKAYGIKTEDGRRFDKNDQIREDFKNSAVYSEVFTDLIETDEKAFEFILGVIPKDIADEVRANIAMNKPQTTD